MPANISAICAASDVNVAAWRQGPVRSGKSSYLNDLQPNFSRIETNVAMINRSAKHDETPSMEGPESTARVISSSSPVSTDSLVFEGAQSTTLLRASSTAREERRPRRLRARRVRTEELQVDGLEVSGRHATLGSFVGSVDDLSLTGLALTLTDAAVK